MTGQMSIFDILYPDRINPIREMAEHSGPMWTHSRKKLIALAHTDPDIKTFAKAVKHHYCPYGFGGHYGGNGKPNTMKSWEMRNNNIQTVYYDSEGKEQERIYSWEDFAREIWDLIMSGKYERRTE